MTLKQWTLNQVQASSLHVEGHCHTKISLSHKINCNIYRFLEAGAYKLTVHVRMHLWFNPTYMSWPILTHTSPYHSRSGTYVSDHSHQVVNWNPEEAAVVQRANIEILGSDK
jgi:hypothetical protein